jgi:hypothetical protein
LLVEDLQTKFIIPFLIRHKFTTKKTIYVWIAWTKEGTYFNSLLTIQLLAFSSKFFLSLFLISITGSMSLSGFGTGLSKDC